MFGADSVERDQRRINIEFLDQIEVRIELIAIGEYSDRQVEFSTVFADAPNGFDVACKKRFAAMDRAGEELPSLLPILPHLIEDRIDLLKAHDAFEPLLPAPQPIPLITIRATEIAVVGRSYDEYHRSLINVMRRE